MEIANTQRSMIFSGLWKWVKFQKKPSIVLWDNLEIPAKLFYKIAETGNLELLIKEGQHSPLGDYRGLLKNAWFTLIDLVYEIRSDQRQRNIQRKQMTIASIAHEISYITTVMRVLYYNYLTDSQRLSLLKILEKRKLNIDEKTLKDKDAFRDEVYKIMYRYIGGLKNRLTIQKQMLEEMQKPLDKKMTFERVCVEISKVFQFSIGINMTLGEFLAYEQSANESVDNMKKNK